MLYYFIINDKGVVEVFVELRMSQHAFEICYTDFSSISHDTVTWIKYEQARQRLRSKPWVIDTADAQIDKCP